MFLGRIEQVREMAFAKHTNMVKTIPSDRTDEPLRISVLPWRAWCNRPIPYAHCAKPPDDDISIDAIPIANGISWRLLPAVSLGQLARNPMGARARGHTQPHKLAAGMLQDQKTIQKAKRNCRGEKKSQPGGGRGTIAPKRIPAPQRGPPSPAPA